jgi:hypothetical protein
MTDTTTELLSAIKSLDLTIRELTEAVKASAHRPTPAPTYTPPKASPTKATMGDIPQPSEIIANAGEVAVHFGTNTGVPLSQLGESSLSWYAQEKEPRLNSRGEPFPPRQEEITLSNAARTLWHQKKGTLKGGENVATPRAPAAVKTPEDEESDLPF